MNRKSILPILLMLLFVARAYANNYADVTVGEAKTFIDSKPFLVILDVRDQSEYDSGHIGKAKLIPIAELASRINELSKTDEILVYCRTGTRSATASQTLADNGFSHVYNMLGGITEWIAAVYPVYVKYSSIQEAVNNASEGSTIYLSSGTYYEHFTLNKSLTINGENKYTTIIDGTENGTVINVKSDNVTIGGLTVQGSGCSCSDYSGIYIKNYHQNTNITNNLIVQNGYGIKLVWSNNVTIDQNEISGNTYGIESIFSSNTTILENDVTENYYGIDLNPSYNDTVMGNNIVKNSFYGIMLHLSSAQDIFFNNTITNSPYGIRLSTCSNNTFHGNRIEGNTIGLQSQNSTNTFYQNSFINNTKHSDLSPGYSNHWDNEYPPEGNFWSNYTGVDLNQDGIGDSPHIMDASNQDNHPLMGTFSTFRTAEETEVNMISNSTVTDFKHTETSGTLAIRVSNSTQDQKTGFLRLTIPHNLMPPPYNITINGNPTSYTTIYENDTLSIIYFTYPHSTLEIHIIPEFPTLTLPPLFAIVALLMFMTYRRKRARNPPK